MDAEKIETSLFNQIEKVKNVRKNLESTKMTMDRFKAMFEAEHEDLFEMLSHWQKSVAEEEAKLRELTITAFEKTGNKKPLPGVGIKITKIIEYDANKVFDWSLHTNPGFLVLDKKAFEAFAKTTSNPAEEWQLKTIEKPTATIAKDL